MLSRGARNDFGNVTDEMKNSDNHNILQYQRSMMNVIYDPIIILLTSDRYVAITIRIFSPIFCMCYNSYCVIYDILWMVNECCCLYTVDISKDNLTNTNIYTSRASVLTLDKKCLAPMAQLAEHSAWIGRLRAWEFGRKLIMGVCHGPLKIGP